MPGFHFGLPLSGTGSHWDTGLLGCVSSLHFSDYSTAWLLPGSLSWKQKPGLDVLNPGTLGTLGMPNRRDNGASPPLHSRNENAQLEGSPSGWAQSCLIEPFAQVPVWSAHGWNQHSIPHVSHSGAGEAGQLKYPFAEALISLGSY